MITLDDVAALAAADGLHRYEFSREGVLSIMPPPSPEHSLIVALLAHRFYAHGYGAEQVIPNCGIDVGGGRLPDLTVWAKDKQPRRARSIYAGLDGLELVTEVVSRDSETIDRVIKRNEYYAAGVPRYWIVGNGTGTGSRGQMLALADSTVHMLALADSTVQMLALAPDGYRIEREVSLTRLLTEPAPAFC